MVVWIALDESKWEDLFLLCGMIQPHYRIEIGLEGNSVGKFVFIEQSVIVYYFNGYLFAFIDSLRVFLHDIFIINLSSLFIYVVMDFLKLVGLSLNKVRYIGKSVNIFKVFTVVVIGTKLIRNVEL